MKFFAFVLLFAAVFSQHVSLREDNKVDHDLIETIKCVLNLIDPLLYEGVDLVEAVRDKNWVKCIMLLCELYENGMNVYEECFKQDPVLGYNWPAFGKCLITEGAKHIAALQPIVDAIMAKDWPSVAELVKEAGIKAIPIVVNCYKLGKGDNEQKAVE